METKIRGDLIALDKKVRGEIERLRDDLLGRYASSMQEVVVELGEERQPGFPMSYNCAITVTTRQGDRVSTRSRERVVLSALRRGFETVALEVKRAMRRRTVATPELAA